MDDVEDDAAPEWLADPGKDQGAAAVAAAAPVGSAKRDGAPGRPEAAAEEGQPGSRPGAPGEGHKQAPRGSAAGGGQAAGAGEAPTPPGASLGATGTAQGAPGGGTIAKAGEPPAAGGQAPLVAEAGSTALGLRTQHRKGSAKVCADRHGCASAAVPPLGWNACASTKWEGCRLWLRGMGRALPSVDGPGQGMCSPVGLVGPRQGMSRGRTVAPWPLSVRAEPREPPIAPQRGAGCGLRDWRSRISHVQRSQPAGTQLGPQHPTSLHRHLQVRWEALLQVRWEALLQGPREAVLQLPWGHVLQGAQCAGVQ